MCWGLQLSYDSMSRVQNIEVVNLGMRDSSMPPRYVLSIFECLVHLICRIGALLITVVVGCAGPVQRFVVSQAQISSSPDAKFCLFADVFEAN